MRFKLSALVFAGGLLLGSVTAAEAGFVPALSFHSASKSHAQGDSKHQGKASSPSKTDSQDEQEGKSKSEASDEDGSDSKSADKQHPCNHGYYVSQAAQDPAHTGKAHGKHVSQVARDPRLDGLVAGGCKALLPTTP